MEIVLALLRTLLFVVATIAATVYVSRRIGRGRSLLWAGSTVLALYWLVLFGWTSYLAGGSEPNPDLAIWVGWTGHLLPFLAALAYIWGIGQSAGFPSRSGAGAGAAVGQAPQTSAPQEPNPTDQATQGSARPEDPKSVGQATPDRSAQSSGVPSPGGQQSPPPAEAKGSSRFEPTSTTTPKGAARPFPGPHAVPMVLTPEALTSDPSTNPPEPSSSEVADSTVPGDEGSDSSGR